ncbi:MAG: DmsC/YnfH family molybdoenzyme membrane anchor subunit [Paracoccaceae bacterium]
MHPAPSIIAFTVLSGLGFGLLTFLGLGAINPTGLIAFGFFTLAYALAVGGLLASTLHLGNPKNALLAFTQWQTSWLSREAWLSVLALVVMGLYAIGAIFFGIQIRFFGILGAALSVATVLATSMIYTQLKTVPRWNQWPTPLLFLTFSLSGGAILANLPHFAFVLLLITGVVLMLHWLQGDTQFAARGSTMETATGLGFIGKVRLLESPHTGSNYLMKEMIYVVGRKHALRLRWIALTLAIVVPELILLSLPSSHLAALLAISTHLVGAFAARWLFFAEAEHVVGLYYGKRQGFLT